MTYVNVDVVDAQGLRFRTKAALRRAVTAGERVYAYPTQAIGTPAWEGGVIGAVPAGIALSVVGPDPYTDRRWYATVTRKRDGSLTVK